MNSVKLEMEKSMVISVYQHRTQSQNSVLVVMHHWFELAVMQHVQLRQMENSIVGDTKR